MDDWDDDPDPDRGDPLDDFVELWSAENPEALWKVLTLRDGLTGAHPFEALGLFRRHHDNGEPGAVTTALLLCTASRWGRDTARLIAGLIDTAVLVEEDLDELASTFLWSDRFRFEYPARWIGSEWISIDLEGPEGPVSVPLGRLDPDSTVPAERYIAPPLRRWAAARVLRTDSRTLDKLRARAAELGPIDGGAIASGVLDAVEVLDARGARRTIELGLDWPRGSVRLLALDVLAAIDPEEAARRAATDPDRKVRAWSPARLRPTRAASAPRLASPRRRTSLRTRHRRAARHDKIDLHAGRPVDPVTDLARLDERAHLIHAQRHHRSISMRARSLVRPAGGCASSPSPWARVRAAPSPGTTGAGGWPATSSGPGGARPRGIQNRPHSAGE